MVRRIARSLWSADLDPALRPVLVLSLLFSAAFSTFWSFVGIFALQRLDASAPTIGVLYLLAFAVGIVSAYVGGELSDRVGRKPVIAFAVAGQSLAALSLISVHTVALGLGLVVLTAALGAPYRSAGDALVADLVPPPRREAAYAAVRVASNLGVVLGPPVGGALLLGGGWPSLLAGVAALGAIASLAALRLLPAVRIQREEGAGTSRVLSLIARDVPFLLLLASTFLGFVVYVAWETVLPVVAVDSFGIAASTWGFVVIINPILVTLCQLRLTRAVEHVPGAQRLLVAMPLMGFSFLLFLLDTSVVAIAVVAVVFVAGEMLWIPTSQSLAARLAPASVRGAYIGAFTASAGAAWTVGPRIALQLRGAAGETPVWLFFAGASVVSALAGVAAAKACR